jgi:uroporphyrinogen-III decarboxylase
MSQIMKAFMGVFLTLFMAATSLGILSAYMEVMSAQDMQARMVDEIENSDFSPLVMRECYAQCEKAGYSLVITLFCEDQALCTIHSRSEVPSDITGVEVAKVELQFPFRVAFLGIETEHAFTGYAR